MMISFVAILAAIYLLMGMRLSLHIALWYWHANHMLKKKDPTYKAQGAQYVSDIAKAGGLRAVMVRSILMWPRIFQKRREFP